MVVGGHHRQCIAQTAREAGAGEIIIADRVPFRLSVARKLDSQRWWSPLRAP
jgi:threonine dehydrogenase-like Zn-dependent dehydrogenase